MSSDPSLHIVIDNRLYDLTLWHHKHPGGSDILRDFHNTDVTDYFYALHSKKACALLQTLKSSPVAPEDRSEPTPLHKLMRKLESAGYFAPDYVAEVLSILHTVVFAVLATWLCDSHPLFAIFCLAGAKLSGGWTGHSMDHSRNNPMKRVARLYTCFFLGFTPAWWGEKHNRHHLSTNEVETDTDIQLMPFIYLWKPNKSNDAWNRKFQHVYFTALYSLLFVLWEIHSVRKIWRDKLVFDMGVFGLHYVWYYVLGWKVCLMGILLAGTVAAWVVTASHQSEEKLFDKKVLTKSSGKGKYQIHDFAEHQIVTTRNMAIDNWFVSYLCGGMQFQIEHHLFPRIPLYKLSTVKDIVKEFCVENGFEYKEEGFVEIMVRNWNTLEHFAALPLTM